MYIRILIFLVLNFGALAIGGFFTGKGVPSDWYQSLVKAPWTPPGWVFGAAWTTIMVCFTFYMAQAWVIVKDRNWLVALFTIQWVLNVLWNPVFFRYHEILVGLVIISLLTLLIGYMLVNQMTEMKVWALLLIPYFIWLIIATSLNAYIYLNPVK